MICVHCNHEWVYKGVLKYATCPSCLKKTPVKRVEVINNGYGSNKLNQEKFELSEDALVLMKACECEVDSESSGGKEDGRKRI